ncbi:heme exporter protein CcmD [Pseudochelatococcus contaminans]|uniref:Heme exporter protein D n=1 Tax=Pseudochelatococcus contaminans TaxID=1538103 RepID=A0A7W5Z2Z4_9HYPH|nr:heme exporter protein CcmD [Pseudochelatococcus contaminans]MBB3808847.1 heme exporter protein D [Pseudochelatococcus contaminans]
MTVSYLGYILAAYAAAAAVVGGLILRAVLDHRAQVRELAALEARGVRRRFRRPEDEA